MTDSSKRLRVIYQVLYDHFGSQHWWPGDSTLEIVVGAVLTQNTNWGNVSQAIANLKAADALSLPALLALPQAELAQLIRPSGYFNLKAQRLTNLLTHLKHEVETCGSLEEYFRQDADSLRASLLGIKGIGPETADSILLYAGGKALFVIDAYTYRFLSRHGLVPEETSYEEMQGLFMDCLPSDAQLYNEYHALLVCLGKEFCRKSNPRCQECPLYEDLPGS